MNALRGLLLGAFLVSSTSRAGAAELGDRAPELHIAKWVKGEPVKVAASESDKLYVVEFWATWCGPCRQSIPHMTEMQKRFKDKVAFVGISDEKENVVAKFVNEMADKMDYRVALDDDRKTSHDYMEAFGIGGIPHAFVVQKDKIIWQGHPMDHLDDTLEQIIAGKYDLKTAKARANAEALYEKFREAAFNGDTEQADKIGTELAVAAKDVKGLFPDDKFDAEKEKKQWRTVYFERQYRQALAKGDDRKAEELGEQLKKLNPEADLEKIRSEAETQKLLMKYSNAVTSSNVEEAKAADGKNLAEKLKGNAQMGNAVAWFILTNERVQHRDIPLALQIAKGACEDSKWNDPQILDTYALALFESGNVEEAVKQETKALELAKEPDMKKMFEESLAKFKQGKGK